MTNAAGSCTITISQADLAFIVDALNHIGENADGLASEDDRDTALRLAERLSDEQIERTPYDERAFDEQMSAIERSDLSDLRRMGDVALASKHRVASHIGSYHRDLLRNVPTTAYSVQHLRSLVIAAHKEEERR